MDEKKKLKANDIRIVGGCPAGHTPWFVYLKITGGCSFSNLYTSALHFCYFLAVGGDSMKCGGVLINKVVKY